jgi:hypothetical protein
VRQLIIDEKQEEDIFGDSTPEQKKKYVLRQVKWKYKRIIDKQTHYPDINQALEDIYDDV